MGGKSRFFGKIFAGFWNIFDPLYLKSKKHVLEKKKVSLASDPNLDCFKDRAAVQT